MNRGGTIEVDPELVKVAHEGEIFRIAERFLEETIGSQVVSTVHVLRAAGGAEDYGDDAAKAGLLSEPLEKFEAIKAWHFQVQEKETGTSSAGIFGGRQLLQILASFLAILNYLEGAWKTRGGESTLEKKNVI
jgi:hypothetical protein